MLIPPVTFLHLASDPPGDIEPPADPLSPLDPAPKPEPVAQSVPPVQPETTTSPAASEGPTSRHARRLQRKNKTDALKRLLSMAVLAGLVGLLFYFITPKPEASPEGNLIRLAERSLPELRFALESSDPAENSQFIETHFGWQVDIPAIQQTRLDGIALIDVTQNAQLPAFVFTDQSGEELVVFVLNYAFLDRYRRQGLFLETTLLESLEQANAFTVEPLDDTEAVVWRSRANIYLALTRDRAEQLVPRIQN